jgi:hypothetical protein
VEFDTLDAVTCVEPGPDGFAGQGLTAPKITIAGEAVDKIAFGKLINPRASLPMGVALWFVQQKFWVTRGFQVTSGRRVSRIALGCPLRT